MRILGGIAVFFALTVGMASAGTPPEQSAGTGVPTIVQRGLPFGAGPAVLGPPVWLPDSAPEIHALGITSASGRGSVVVHAILADTHFYYAFAGPQVRALVAGDEAGLRDEASSWYIATWDRAIRPYLIKGENAVFVVRNVPMPSAERPLKAVLFAGAAEPPAVAAPVLLAQPIGNGSAQDRLGSVSGPAPAVSPPDPPSRGQL